MLTIGVDVGGTSIKSALISVEDGKYSVIKSYSVSTQGDKGANVIVDNIVRSIKAFDYGSAECIGIATAGTVDWDKGYVTYATDALKGFTGLELSGIVSDRIGRRVRVVNDAVGALVAECFCGAGVGYDRVMMFTLGTGLGAGLLQDRRLDSNSVVDTRLGHYTLKAGGDRRCFCGSKGCAECYVSATGLKKSAKTNDLREVFTNAGAKYTAVLDDFFKDFISIVKVADDRYKPDLIIVGGGVVELGNLWWNDWVQRCGKAVDTPLQRASLGNMAGVIGAVYCAINGEFKYQ
ncbi:MAG: ROK family protein [Christensenellales bacterium]